MERTEFQVDLAQVKDFEFRVRFTATGAPELIVDEPPPLGKGIGPNPARLLAAAVANCLAASLVFCFRKAELKIAPIQAEAHGALARNDRGRWRIGSLSVVLKLPETLKTAPALGRCLQEFEDFCIVTESVRSGIPVAVRVLGNDGEMLSESPSHLQSASSGYYIAVTVNAPFDTVVARVVQALNTEGFGVLTDIDVQATLKAKIGADMPRYRILGACNPRFAREALALEDKLGVLLPCNVIVRETADGGVEVASVDPVTAMQRTGNPALESIARDVRARLMRVTDALRP